MSRVINGINDIPTILDQNKTNGVNEERLLFQNRDEGILNSLVQNFFEDKQRLDKYKKFTETANQEIKDLMHKLNINEFETDSSLIAKLTHKQSESFNEEKLLAKMKELNIPGIIKTREYVDMDALENQIYLGNIDASKLSNCRETKKVVTLKVTKKSKK